MDVSRKPNSRIDGSSEADLGEEIDRRTTEKAEYPQLVLIGDGIPKTGDLPKGVPETNAHPDGTPVGLIETLGYFEEGVAVAYTPNLWERSDGGFRLVFQYEQPDGFAEESLSIDEGDLSRAVEVRRPGDESPRGDLL